MPMGCFGGTLSAHTLLGGGVIGFAPGAVSARAARDACSSVPVSFTMG